MDYFPSWAFLALGLVVQMQYFFANLTMPSQDLGILFIMIGRMLGGDVTKFLKVFIIILINYGFAMYIAYPHTGDVFRSNFSPDMNSIPSALQALIQMAVLGENIPIDFSPYNFAPMNTAQKLESAGYVMLLYMYIIMSLILLLNLLIAMMGDTYATVLDQAVREWRVGMAQLVLRLEILARPFTDVRSGEQYGDEYFKLNRTFDEISEVSGGGLHLKASSTFSNQDDAVCVIQRTYKKNLKPRLSGGIGLRWRDIGSNVPARGKELFNEPLGMTLYRGKLEFTVKELERLDVPIPQLRLFTYVRAGPPDDITAWRVFQPMPNGNPGTDAKPPNERQKRLPEAVGLPPPMPPGGGAGGAAGGAGGARACAGRPAGASGGAAGRATRRPGGAAGGAGARPGGAAGTPSGSAGAR
jgi:hypothetical protein